MEQIAEFIIKNTQSETIGNQIQSNYFDPFTGDSRYDPSCTARSQLQTQNLSCSDPFTSFFSLQDFFFIESIFI